MQPVFLRLDEVLAIHQDMVRRYGGASGIRDLGLLESALGNASATFDGVFLHSNVFEMAAAYLYGICKNHPFVDGNKRTALACAIAFLGLNRKWLESDSGDLYDLVIGVAEGRVSKAAVAVFFENHVK